MYRVKHDRRHVPFKEGRSWQGIAHVWHPGMACTICCTSCHIPLLWISYCHRNTKLDILHNSFRIALCIETFKKIPVWLLSSSVPDKTTAKSTCKEIPGHRVLHTQWQGLISIKLTRCCLYGSHILRNSVIPTTCTVYRDLCVRRSHADSLIRCAQQDNCKV